jgi:uncharacterized protein (DUF2147 family)
MKTFVSFCFALLFATVTMAQVSPVGVWKTIDDKTGKAKSHVEIYKKDGKLFGKVTKLLLKPSDTLCKECTGDKQNKPVIGMVILEDLQPYKYYWKSGTILDPENGSTYGCSIWFEDNKEDELQVRGKHWTGIFRTQTWYRIKE